MDKLRALKLRTTPQRTAIMQYLDGNTLHPSVDDIYKSLIEKYPSISLATVYNTLEALTKRGVLRELTIDPQKKRFDPNLEAHHHLMCVACKKIIDGHGDVGQHLAPAEQGDFEIQGHHIDIYGLCSACKK